MIKILMAIPTLNQYEARLPITLNTLMASTRPPDRLLIIDNGHRWHQMPYANEIARVFNLDVFTPHTNLGVAGSVNYALRNTPDDWYWLHCNDDVDLDSECIQRLADEAEDRDFTFLVPGHGEGSAFTVFLAYADNLKEHVGYFDEQFFPAYLEDNDYGLRLNKASVKRVIVRDAAYIHHTSSTLKSYDAAQTRRHHDQFRANMERYIAKWGGGPDKETFDVPYDGARGHNLSNFNLWHKERL
jgi:GT2 family glycosyltransferase